jgi:hypothetical protein
VMIRSVVVGAGVIWGSVGCCGTEVVRQQACPAGRVSRLPHPLIQLLACCFQRRGISKVHAVCACKPPLESGCLRCSLDRKVLCGEDSAHVVSRGPCLHACRKWLYMPNVKQATIVGGCMGKRSVPGCTIVFCRSMPRSSLPGCGLDVNFRVGCVDVCPNQYVVLVLLLPGQSSGPMGSVRGLLNAGSGLVMEQLVSDTLWEWNIL